MAQIIVFDETEDENGESYRDMPLGCLFMMQEVRGWLNFHFTDKYSYNGFRGTPGRSLMLNVSNIISIEEQSVGTSLIKMQNGDEYLVKESVETIADKINECLNF